MEALLIRPFQDAEVHSDVLIKTMVILPYGRLFTNNHNVTVEGAWFCGFGQNESIAIGYRFLEKAVRGFKRVIFNWLIDKRFTVVNQHDYINALLKRGTNCPFCQNPFESMVTKDADGNITIQM